MKIHFLKSSQKKKILSSLKEEYGFSELPYLFIQSGKEKLRAYTGSLSKDELQELNKSLNIESLGLYAMKEEKENYRLTPDFIHLNKKQITKKIILLNEEQLNSWLRGLDLQISSKILGLVFLEYDNLFVGSGVSNGGTIFNYLPKERRIKS